jgi:hypothetical protein
MGYRIHYSLAEGTLSAVVSGKSTLATAGCIARDIAAQADRQAAGRVMIDLRWLEDRIGTLRALLRLPALRVAVVDVGENDPYYVLREHGALRYFGDTGSALHWLNGKMPGDAKSPRGDRNQPKPGGALRGTRLAIYGG